MSIINPLPISLNLAAPYAIIASTAVTNTGNSVINSNLAISPNNASSITGFPPGVINGITSAGTPAANFALISLQTAINDGFSRTSDQDLSGQDLGGLTLPSGVYNFTSSAQNSGILTLDWNNDPDAVWIFQITTTLTTSPLSSVVFTNVPIGTHQVNVFWVVGTSATLQTETQMEGVILAQTSISTQDGTTSSALMAHDGAVTLINTSVENYANSTVTAADPHIIGIDGSRLDVYEPGIYRMFNDFKGLIINCEVSRKEDTHEDYYSEIKIFLPNVDISVKYTDEDLQINKYSKENNSSELITEKEYFEYYYIQPNNKYYIFKFERMFKTFMMETNLKSEKIILGGLLATQIIKIHNIYDTYNYLGTEIIPGYYKYNALFCGSTVSHIVTHNKESLSVLPGGNYRLLQFNEMCINVQLNNDGRICKLKILNDIWEFNGDFWNLDVYKNGDKNLNAEYEDYNFNDILVRVQSNGSVSCAFRTLEIENLGGIILGDVGFISDLNNTEKINNIQYKNTFRIEEGVTLYQRYMEMTF
uniref:Uncharacterized protein n=1 Tax=viral metagenome TaxID=1070528 RepID=A0A6C0ADC7_9ZZZZ